MGEERNGFRQYGGWIVAGLAILYAVNVSSDDDRSISPTVSPQAAFDFGLAQPNPEAAPEPIPAVAPVAAKGWYDPRYVTCIANCEQVEARIPSGAEDQTTPRLVYLRAPDTAPPVETYALPATPSPPPSEATFASAPASRETDTYQSYAAVPPPPVSTAPAVGCAENGSCYGDISAATGAPKTVAVSGYYRRDGTYVRGHYRSH